MCGGTTTADNGGGLFKTIGSIGNAINQGLSIASSSMNNADEIMINDATGETGAVQDANRAANAQNALIAQNQQQQENAESQASGTAAALRTSANQSSNSKTGFNSAPSAAILGVSMTSSPNMNTLGL